MSEIFDPRHQPDQLERLITKGTPRGGVARFAAVRCRDCEQVLVVSSCPPGDPQWKAVGAGWGWRDGLLYCQECK